MKLFMRILLGIVLVPVLAFALFLLVFSLLDYRPDAREDVPIKGLTAASVFPDTLTVLTWNIGYGGLGAEQDFFFDGGYNVRPTAHLSDYYLNGILGFLAEQRNVDVLMLQEVDKDSRRSYHVDQETEISKAMPGYAYGFAYNYKTQFVPEPIREPYGKCMAGLMTLGRVKPGQSTRHALAADATWPVGLFMLDRCFLTWRYPDYFKDGSDLILINVHLSAYDDGSVKQRQMDSLAAFLRMESRLGNRIIVGGDWNQQAPGYRWSLAASQVKNDFPDPGWTWVAPDTTTNRALATGYEPDKTLEVCIDYFLLSPNLKAVEVKRINQYFSFSDHEPVQLKVALKN